MSRGHGAGEMGAEPSPMQTKRVTQCALRDIIAEAVKRTGRFSKYLRSTGKG